jgi:hypothetical protein
VQLVNDEARSYIARSPDRFDVIQISMIDTWAATAAGAFALTENSLYTTDAWRILLDHLNPSGVLTVSRWYFRGTPAEAYRLTALASAALADAGIATPRDHIVIVRRMLQGETPDQPDGVATLLLSKQPWTAADLDTIQQVSDRMEYDVVLSPRVAADATFAALTTGVDLDKVTGAFPLNISPPTDDSPYFFQMLRIRDAFNRSLQQQGIMSFNMKAVGVLGILFLIVLILTLLSIVVPLVLTTDRSELRRAGGLSLFFACIGLGFMLVEVSQVQRLIVFLGHPTYGLSVVLFTLLLSSGIGSVTTGRTSVLGLEVSAPLRLLLLIGVLILFGIGTPSAIHAFQGAETPVRILVAIGLLLPAGLFMGMAFPFGMKLALQQSPALTPWFWGINGATSVCASVLAAVIALGFGISASFWTGFACYVVGVAAFCWESRSVAVQVAPARGPLAEDRARAGLEPVAEPL